MTWLHDEDRADPIDGAGRHVATANGFVVANADEQWFHEPGVHPWMTKGKRMSLSADLIPGYGQREAEQSPRRAEATALARTVANAQISNEPVPMVTVRNAASPPLRRPAGG